MMLRMRFHGNSFKQSLVLGFAIVISSCTVFLMQWSWISRRLSKETLPILIVYGVISLLLIAGASLMRKNKHLLLWAAFVPYLAASLAYAFALTFWAISRSSIYSFTDLSGFLMVTMFAPYLAIWGPLISMGSVLLTWIMCRRLLQNK